MMVNTIPIPEKIAPATKYGAKIVACQPGVSAIAKSNDTVECTESTSGVDSAARKRYARAKCRHSRSELRHPIDSMPKIFLRIGCVSRSRIAAKSGIIPMKRNVDEIVRYVRIANTSHTSGLLNCGHTRRQLGYGISQKNFHGRPRCRIGKSPAGRTAKTVIASAAR